MRKLSYDAKIIDNNMLIDEVTIQVKAGDGGKGAVAFQKNKMSLGPTGTRGGEGGSIFAIGVSDLSALNQFINKKEVGALNGKDGRGQFRDGHAGEDLIIKIPVGTVIHNLTTKSTTEITKINEKKIIAEGGRGGKGNFFFRSSTNTSPKEFQFGLPGEKFTIKLELKLIADIGLIGLPNVGKSSLLNELTRAQAKIGNYPFTTLEPNLGTYYELILADIPGLIEGASHGKGLGTKFLRHIERTKTLFHLVSAESPNPEIDYKIIREELKIFNKQLLEKPEHIIISKIDSVGKTGLEKIFNKLEKHNPSVLKVSIYNKESLKSLKNILNKLKDEKIEKK